jgi:hypothetical protein
MRCKTSCFSKITTNEEHGMAAENIAFHLISMEIYPGSIIIIELKRSVSVSHAHLPGPYGA